MILVLLCLILHSTPNAIKAPINWNQTKQWNIYALNNSSNVFTMPIDSIRTLRGVPLNDDTMHILLKSVKLLHVPSSPAWMGCYLTSCEDEKGKLIKIVISQYGGFFLNSNDGDYYQLDAASTRLWLDYIRRTYVKTE